MGVLDDHIKWLKEQIEWHDEYVAMLRSGKIRTRAQQAGEDWRDTTEETIKEYLSRRDNNVRLLTTLKRQLKEHP